MTMTFGQAGVFSLLGIGVVFFALILLMCIIKIMTAVGDRAEKKEAPAAAPIPAPVDGPVVPLKQTGPVAPGSAGELKLYDTDPRVAAMLMAIVADELNTPVNELRFLSIKEIKEEEKE